MIALTHCGKLGDFLYSLPIGSWLHKTTGEKIHWVLPYSFGPFNYIKKLLEYQSITGKVSIILHNIDNFGCGGQPYKFDPSVYGITDKYYNLGYRHYPNCYISRFMAEEYGLGYDRDFVLETEPVMPEPGLVVRTEQLQCIAAAPEAKTFQIPSDLYDIAVFMKTGSVRHTWLSGIAVICYLMKIHQVIHSNHSEKAWRLFMPDSSNITWVREPDIT